MWTDLCPAVQSLARALLADPRVQASVASYPLSAQINNAVYQAIVHVHHTRAQPGQRWTLKQIDSFMFRHDAARLPSPVWDGPLPEVETLA